MKTSVNHSGLVCLETEPSRQPRWCVPVILALRRLRREHREFEDSLGCVLGEEEKRGQRDGDEEHSQVRGKSRGEPGPEHAALGRSV